MNGDEQWSDEAHLGDLSGWKSAGAIQPPRPRAGARQAGKSTRSRCLMLAAAAADQHVHYYGARDGLWCLTVTQLGPLWVRLPQPSRGRSRR